MELGREIRTAAEVIAYGRHLLDYSAKMMAATLAAIPDGIYRAVGFPGQRRRDAGAAANRRRNPHSRDETAEVDFTGSAPQCAGSVNAVEAITWSAVFYVFRCLLDEQVPATSGLMRSIRVIAPQERSSTRALRPQLQEETWKLLSALWIRCCARSSRAIPSRIPAASQGTMNNLSLAAWTLRRGAGKPFAYYETIAGGTGGGPGFAGASATQSHMTNTLNTPTEVLEHAYPVRVLRYALRNGSGGNGKFPGGDGIIREIEMLTDVQMGILSDRRKLPPYGLAGGKPGKAGKNELIVRGRARRAPIKMHVLCPGWGHDPNRNARAAADGEC